MYTDFPQHTNIVYHVYYIKFQWLTVEVVLLEVPAISATKTKHGRGKKG